jgi:hypothetical protein
MAIIRVVVTTTITGRRHRYSAQINRHWHPGIQVVHNATSTASNSGVTTFAGSATSIAGALCDLWVHSACTHVRHHQ